MYEIHVKLTLHSSRCDFKKEWLLGDTHFPEIMIVTSRLYKACGPRGSTLKPMTTMCAGTESV